MEAAWVLGAVLAACGSFTREMKPLAEAAVCFPWRPQPQPTEPGQHWPCCDPLTWPSPETTHLRPQQQLLPGALSKQEIWVAVLFRVN